LTVTANVSTDWLSRVPVLDNFTTKTSG
jgi:hypothetical protein